MEEEVYMCTVNFPPVDGWRDISPREVEKVLRSSWANWEEVSLVGAGGDTRKGGEGRPLGDGRYVKRNYEHRLL